MDDEFVDYNLDEMSEDEKDDFIDGLAEAYNDLLGLSITLSNALGVLSLDLQAGNRFGKRRRTIQLAALKAAIMNSYGIALMGFDPEKIDTDTKFENIVRNFDEDGE